MPVAAHREDGWLEDPALRARVGVVVNKLRLLPQMMASMYALDSDDRLLVNASSAASGLVGMLCESRDWHVKVFLWAPKQSSGVYVCVRVCVCVHAQCMMVCACAVYDGVCMRRV